MPLTITEGCRPLVAEAGSRVETHAGGFGAWTMASAALEPAADRKG